ncbi:MAG TPA: sigma-70 family RNA polymerase sigma factor [Verrucomicrobiae bacterium]|nr:sigma-70 family RNA polymerase sigma factor [Verrucomicrobiae bacterium]
MKANNHDPRWAAGSGVLALNSTVFQDLVERLLQSCLQRLPRRSIPPSWSSLDWQQEIEQVVALAIMRALNDFHLVRGEDPERFVFRRVDSDVRNRQRREWAFGRRFQPMVSESHLGADEHSQNAATRVDLVVGPDHSFDDLQQAILQLPEPQRRAIVLLFFEDLTEALAAQKLHLGQPAVNRLKRAGLDNLRKYFCRTGGSSNGEPPESEPQHTQK